VHSAASTAVQRVAWTLSKKVATLWSAEGRLAAGYHTYWESHEYCQVWHNGVTGLPAGQSSLTLYGLDKVTNDELPAVKADDGVLADELATSEDVEAAEVATTGTFGARDGHGSAGAPWRYYPGLRRADPCGRVWVDRHGRAHCRSKGIGNLRVACPFYSQMCVFAGCANVVCCILPVLPCAHM
jgi:hypothetical protein